MFTVQIKRVTAGNFQCVNPTNHNVIYLAEAKSNIPGWVKTVSFTIVNNNSTVLWKSSL